MSTFTRTVTCSRLSFEDGEATRTYQRVACPRCGFTHDTQVCGFCGRDREDTAVALERPTDTPVSYRALWLRHLCTDESGSPTRSASSPVDARAWAGAAIAAPTPDAPVTEQPAALSSLRTLA